MTEENNEVKIDEYLLTSINPTTHALGIKLQGENGNRTISMMLPIENVLTIELLVDPFCKMRILDLPPVFPCDFLKTVLDALGTDIIKIVIYNLEGEEYFAQLHLLFDDMTGTIDIDAYDALSLVARFGTSLYVCEKVFGLCDEKKHSRINWYDLYEAYAFDVLNQMPQEKMTSYPVDELNMFLEKAVEKEEYSLAAKVRRALEEKGERGEE